MNATTIRNKLNRMFEEFGDTISVLLYVDNVPRDEFGDGGPLLEPGFDVLAMVVFGKDEKLVIASQTTEELTYDGYVTIRCDELIEKSGRSAFDAIRVQDEIVIDGLQYRISAIDRTGRVRGDTFVIKVYFRSKTGEFPV